MYRFLVLASIVCYSTHGFPHGGRKAPPVKRSDYSMYDNQFFSVGDTKLDNEVTDCGLVRHQYARGYIRLREYLERMQGCGKAGKRKNVEGIAASTRDAKDTTTDGFHIPSNSAVHVAPFKPRPIGEIIDNIDKKQSQVKAFSNPQEHDGVHPELPFQQHSLQKSQTQHSSFIDMGSLTQHNRALSYKQNIAANGAVLPGTRKFLLQKTLNVQATSALNSANGKEQQEDMTPDPQRYYSLQNPEVKHAYSGPITVGQPLLRPNPLSFDKQPSTGSKLRLPQGDQSANPDFNMDRNNESAANKQQIIAQAGNRHAVVPQRVKQVWQGRDNHFQDDFQGQNGVKDEGTDFGDMQSDPIPAATTFTENPGLEEEDKDQESERKLGDSSKQQESIAKQTNQELKSTDAQKETSIDGLAPDEKQNTAQLDAKDLKQGDDDDIEGKDKISSEQSETKKLNDFLKPDSTTNHDRTLEHSNGRLPVENESNAITSEASRTSKSQKSVTEDKKGLTINLDVLKNKISSSKDIGFLKRMLTLIKKITHHKDFEKLAGVQKDAIMQAGKAVNTVVNKESNIARSFINPRPVSGNLGYYKGVESGNSHTTLHAHPPRWKVGDRTITGSTHAQVYDGVQHQVSKKFKIERNPYYLQQRRVSYTPPYFSLQRLNYGIYNGNVP